MLRVYPSALGGQRRVTPRVATPLIGTGVWLPRGIRGYVHSAAHVGHLPAAARVTAGALAGGGRSAVGAAVASHDDVAVGRR